MGRTTLSKSEKLARAARRKKAMKRFEGQLKKWRSVSSVTYPNIQVLSLCRRLLIRCSDLQAEVKKQKGYVEACHELMHRPRP